jgi:hypothetical protein
MPIGLDNLLIRDINKRMADTQEYSKLVIKELDDARELLSQIVIQGRKP